MSSQPDSDRLSTVPGPLWGQRWRARGWDTVPGVRWNRLFDELEAQAADLEREERDSLVDELRDGDWAETSWRELLGGRVVLGIAGGGRLEGEAVLVNEQLVQLRGDQLDHVVAASAVTVVHAAERRAEEIGHVAASLGWGHVFRALRDGGDAITIRLRDGSVLDGTIAVVGRDFVRVASAAGRTQDVVWSAVAVVTGRS